MLGSARHKSRGFLVVWWLSGRIRSHWSIYSLLFYSLTFFFFVITRYHTMRFWRKLEETFLLASRTFLNQNFRDKTAGKPQNLESTFSKKRQKLTSNLSVDVFKFFCGCQGRLAAFVVGIASFFLFFFEGGLVSATPFQTTTTKPTRADTIHPEKSSWSSSWRPRNCQCTSQESDDAAPPSYGKLFQARKLHLGRGGLFGPFKGLQRAFEGIV